MTERFNEQNAISDDDDGWPAITAQLGSDGRHDSGVSIRLPSHQPSPPLCRRRQGVTPLI